MKPILLTALVFALHITAQAQHQKFELNDDLIYAVIKDTDGFVNIRKASTLDAPIIGKIYNYCVFSCDTTNTNWWKVLYIQYNK